MIQRIQVTMSDIGTVSLCNWRQDKLVELGTSSAELHASLDFGICAITALAMHPY
jgi:hypothetical protein